MTELKNELKNELKRLENKHKELLGYRRFMRRNCDIIVLESRKLGQDEYKEVLIGLTNKIKLSSQAIKELIAKICPQSNRMINRVMPEVEHIMNMLRK